MREESGERQKGEIKVASLEKWGDPYGWHTRLRWYGKQGFLVVLLHGMV